MKLTSCRAIFLPIMVVTLPLPSQVSHYFPLALVEFLQWFAFWSFAGLLTIPWLFCVYQLVTHNLGRKKRIRHVLDEVSAPKVVIVMPCYKEKPDILLRTVDSLVDCEYPPSCLHIFLSFDGDQEDELFLNTIEKLGVPLTLESYPKSIDVTYRRTRITVSRFPHGGKRHCQKRTFKLIDKIYKEYLKRNDNLFVLFIDSDCILDRVCIQNFMYEMELKPGSKRNMLAMTGVITSTTKKNSLITLLQDMEYIHGQLFERSVESGCGAVTCLPGALTILRFSAFRKMAKYYFADKAEQCDDLFDYGKCHLGEDRWLTHLFMIGAKERYQIQMNTGAFCKTEAVQEYKSLLKQRRRWFLGFITNEVCMLTDIRLWRRYPILCLVRFAQNTIRTTALLFFIMVISLITTSQTIDQLPVGFIGVSLGLNWLLMLYFAAKLGRYKTMLYPIMFVVNPFFNWVYMVYGIFTAGQRTWGGPRADAAQADTHVSPQAAIEQAEETGDDLNVVPETFKPAVQAQATKHQGRPPILPLQPSGHIEGRFVAPERGEEGWYIQSYDSGLTLPDMMPRNPDAPHVPLHPRESFDSAASVTSASNSIYMPRRVESIVGSEDARLYRNRQATQKPAGGAFYEAPRPSPYIGTNNPIEPSHEETVVSSDDDDDALYLNKHSRRSRRSRGTSDYALSSAGSRSRDHSPVRHSPLAYEACNDAPSMMHPDYRSAEQASSSQVPLTAQPAKAGRSPLARASFTRTVTKSPVNDVAIELKEQQRIPLMTRIAEPLVPVPSSPASAPASAETTSLGPDEQIPQQTGRGRTSVESSRCRRLTKSRPGSKQSRNKPPNA